MKTCRHEHLKIFCSFIGLIQAVLISAEIEYVVKYFSHIVKLGELFKNCNYTNFS